MILLYTLLIWLGLVGWSLPSPHLEPKVGPRRICPGTHIRNDLKSFDQLKGCEVIEGPLTIALVQNLSHPFKHKDYENITFPHLTEVTDYLLFFRVQGLQSLSTLFPNLAVIRGKELVTNYALIIYEMFHLETIHLPRLADILRGSVRIESNPNLCYASTVNWGAICKVPYEDHFMKGNNPRCNNVCPDHCRPWSPKSNAEPIRIKGDVKELGSSNRKSTYCWTSQACNDFCPTLDGNNLPISMKGGCCSPQCAGGCYEPERSDKCLSCRSVSQEGKCVEHCDQSLYEYKGKCIDEQTCILMVETVSRGKCDKLATHIIYNKAVRILGEKYGRCQEQCPTGFEEDPMNKNKCKPCDQGRCRKVCTPPQSKSYMVTDINSLMVLRGCNVVNASLEIAIKGGKNVMRELENTFQDLEEIKGFLKITRSYPLLTLGFLDKLKAINGSELDRDQYSLIIIDNPNLKELFLFKNSHNDQKQLNILNGKIFVHLNPKLCPQTINNLKSYAHVSNWDETDVSPHTNGDKGGCETEKLELLFVQGSSTVAMIKFQNYALRLNDSRSLLYYLINYRKALNGTVTMFDGRDGCNSQNDVWITQESAPSISKFRTEVDEYQEAVIEVKPATRYALYVKTFTIDMGSPGAISDIIYFETAPYTPGIPRDLGLSATHNSILASWSPPSKPNGVIDRYYIAVSKQLEGDEFQNFDTCDSIIDRDDVGHSPTEEDTKKSTLLIQPPSNPARAPSSSDASDSCSTSPQDPELQTDVVTFQDKIIDLVYLKYEPCILPQAPSKLIRKRSIEYNIQRSGDTSTNLDANATISLESSSTSTPNTPRTITYPGQASATPVQAFKHPIIKFNRSLNKTEQNITAISRRQDEKMVVNITALDHYTKYQIEVVACHGEFVGTKVKTDKTYSRCGFQAITQIRTAPIVEYDRVLAETIVFQPANETSNENRVTWKPPDRPNGLILSYRVRYRPKYGASSRWTETCINMTSYDREKGFILQDLTPGTYLLSIQTISMYSGSRLWSEPAFELEIPQNYLLSPLVLTIIIIALLVISISAIVSAAYYHQKRKHERLIYASVNPDYIEYNPDEWEVDRAKVVVGDQIGTGSFGMVYKGELITEKGRLQCAIKTVPPTSTAKQRIDFLREASIMKQFDTYHVVKLMGVVSISTPVYVIMEYMKNGDLKSYLRHQRDVYQAEKKPLVDGIYLMATQIADGMAYLASKKFVHRDLAARNCMVGDNKIVKVADFGLTRDIYANDYYRRDTHGRLPVRWMAPESLSDNLYTTASDVWSYGIVVWEILTFSAFPYQGLSNDEVIKRVTVGYTMPKPENCPKKLQYIMERCWKMSDKERPSFNEIVEYLLPDTEDQLYPNCFYRRPKDEAGDSIATQTIPEDANAEAASKSGETPSGTTAPESYPLLSWPSTNRANGSTTNGIVMGRKMGQRLTS